MRRCVGWSPGTINAFYVIVDEITVAEHTPPKQRDDILGVSYRCTSGNRRAHGVLKKPLRNRQRRKTIEDWFDEDFDPDCFDLHQNSCLTRVGRGCANVFPIRVRSEPYRRGAKRR
ncbi:unnamed protein product [Sphagnum jensenii]|uniref:Uncharacterized protein n=1 Tax=Sphagnum jensenii TaxID=128206 RepID=A0ABP0VC60_9BRYO